MTTARRSSLADRAWTWLEAHDKGVMHEHSLSLAALLAAVRRETLEEAAFIAECCSASGPETRSVIARLIRGLDNDTKSVAVVDAPKETK